MFFLRARSKPSPYPLLPYHVLRTFQLFSALITSSILCYFIWHLRDEHYPVPWTFIFLLTAALLALPLFAISSYLHATSPHLIPKRSLLYFNLPLAIIWATGLALLTWNLSYTLSHRCTLAQWRNEAGIMVCRMYKALTAFAVTGTASTLSALILDWRVWRGQGGGRGGYGMMRLPEGVSLSDVKRKQEEQDGHTSSGEGDETNGFSAARTAGDQRAGFRVGALWDGEQKGLTRPWKATRTLEVKDFGYAVPEGQTTYAGERGASMDICER